MFVPIELGSDPWAMFLMLTAPRTWFILTSKTMSILDWSLAMMNNKSQVHEEERKHWWRRRSFKSHAQVCPFYCCEGYQSFTGLMQYASGKVTKLLFLTVITFLQVISTFLYCSLCRGLILSVKQQTTIPAEHKTIIILRIIRTQTLSFLVHVPEVRRNSELQSLRVNSR